MAESRRPNTVRADETEAQEDLAQSAYAQLPPPGHQRREMLRRNADNLEREVDALASKVLMGRLDEKYLKLQSEITSRTKFLHVSNADPAYCYCWISKNSNGHHIQRAEQLGWRVVQGDDPEAVELKGSGGAASGAGSPDSTRQLGDVILMKIPRDKYLLLRALERARVVQLHESSASDLQSLIDRHRKHFKLYNAPETQEYSELGGPPIQPQTFTAHPRSPFGRRRASMERLDRHLRAGTLPGMEMREPA